MTTMPTGISDRGHDEAVSYIRVVWSDGLFLKEDISKKIPLSIALKEWGITPWIQR